jgi:hypothetical protein
MEEDKNLPLVSSNSDGYNMGMVLMLACMVLSWIFIHRWNQRQKRGPKTWPIVGAAIEQFMNYNQMHDWLVKYLSELRTVVVPMPFTTYTYIADPANVEHVLKTNFANYPKVTACKTIYYLLIYSEFNNVSALTLNFHPTKFLGFKDLS